MGLIGFITYEAINSINTDDHGGHRDNATVYITLYDTATGQPANGNYATVTYTIDEYNNGIGLQSTHQVSIPGQSVRIYKGVINEESYSIGGMLMYTYSKNFAVVNVSSDTIEEQIPSGCDIAITSVSIINKESAPGASDAQININATTSFGPLQYSLDGVTYQSSAMFSGLHGGYFTAYVKDANACTTTLGFDIPILSSLLISDPAIDLGNGNISRWSAAYNPIVFTYQRKDFEVSNITANNSNLTVITLNTGTSALQTEDLVYLKAGHYAGTYKVKEAAGSNITLDVPFKAGTPVTGFANINRLRPYYKLLTEITYVDKLSGKFDTITSTNRPDLTGLIKADLSSFLQSLLKPADESDYTQVNYRDDNLSASYTIRYAEYWDDGSTEGYTSGYSVIDHPYYVTYSAKQLGDTYGGNMAAYIPFKSVISNTQRAKWITDFNEPAYSPSYPFDIGFIYSEHLAGLNIYCDLRLLDINRKPLPGGSVTSYLLNENSSYLLNNDGSRLIIARAGMVSTPIAEHVGLNRLLITGPFPNEAWYFDITLKYDDDAGNTHTVSQVQSVRIDKAGDDRSVYLRWIGLTGSWNYYRFVYNQEISLDVQNAVIIKNYVNDWENQQSIEEVISKNAGQKMKVIAEDLSVSDIKGLQSIKYSPKVQMLVNKNPAKWQTVVVNTATYSEYDTLNGQAPFSITFNLPAINIQTQ